MTEHTRWQCRRDTLAGGRGERLTVLDDGQVLSYDGVLAAWRDDTVFRTFFSASLARCPFRAFRWEVPPVTGVSRSRDFECVLLDSPSLSSTADPRAFAGHFAGAADTTQTVCFDNLGRDATLIVPCPLGPADTYAHIAAFLRGAPEPQRQALWRSVAEAMEPRIGPDPLWLSTAGAGVAWLHVRLDRRPKYYGHTPYRRMC